MKGFNVFLAVLIFLLAATSAVFSFFLFEKRAKLVSGYETFTQSIVAAVEKLDRNSGTDVASIVRKEAMDHSKDPDLPKILKNFNEQTNKVVDARDALASALDKLSVTLEQNPSIKAAEFSKISDEKKDNYSTKIALLQRYASSYVTRNNSIINNIKNSAEKLDAKDVTVKKLKSKDYSAAFTNLNNRIAFWVTRNEYYTNFARRIAAALQLKKHPDLNESKYKKDLDELVSAANAVRQQVNELNKTVTRCKGEIETLNKIIGDKDKLIKAQQKKIAAKEGEIKHLRTIMGEEGDRQPLADGCEESLNMVKTQGKGKILEVDDKFGFVVISLGRKTRVQEPFGKETHHIDPQIPQGAVLTVARKMFTGDAEYINKIKITRLDDNASIAEPIDKKTGKRMRTGDIVYFADDEIARLIKDRK